MFAYNFGSSRAKGAIRAKDKPSNWILDREVWNLSIDPMQRELFETTLTVPAGQGGTLRFTGDFGSEGKSVLALRIHGKKRQRPGKGDAN